MKKLFILTFFLIYFSSYGQKEENELIQFNGIYENKVKPDKNNKVFLRFYPNGKVIRVLCLSTVTVFDVKDWLNLEMSESDEIGNYKLNQKIIKFSIYDSFNDDYPIEFKGKVVKNKILSLSVNNLITGSKSEFSEDFFFIRINDLK